MSADITFDGLIERAKAEGPRRFAAWNAGAYAELCAGPAKILWERLGPAQTGRAEVMQGYLRLLSEGVGLGYLDRTSLDPTQPRSLLALGLCRLIPEGLALIGEGEQLPLLVRLWNIAEGLEREPAWLNRYVAGAGARIVDLARLEESLIEILEPALAPSFSASWSGPFRVTHLDTRGAADEFLPGRMHLAAPAVMCVHDRREQQRHIGVFLRKEGDSRCTDVVPCLGEAAVEGPVPEISHTNDGLRIGAAVVRVPFLRFPYRHAISPSGFVLLSAVDSQRLWIVETP